MFCCVEQCTANKHYKTLGDSYKFSVMCFCNCFRSHNKTENTRVNKKNWKCKSKYNTVQTMKIERRKGQYFNIFWKSGNLLQEWKTNDFTEV